MQHDSRTNDIALEAAYDASTLPPPESPSVRELWQTYRAAGRRLEQVTAMAGPYALVEREMLQRRRTALAARIQKLAVRHGTVRSATV